MESRQKFWNGCDDSEYQDIRQSNDTPSNSFSNVTQYVAQYEMRLKKQRHFVGENRIPALNTATKHIQKALDSLLLAQSSIPLGARFHLFVEFDESSSSNNPVSYTHLTLPTKA